MSNVILSSNTANISSKLQQVTHDILSFTQIRDFFKYRKSLIRLNRPQNIWTLKEANKMRKKRKRE